MTRTPKHAWAAILILALARCSDQPAQPHLHEQEGPGKARLVPQPGGLSCSAPDAKLSSGALYKVCVPPDKWNGDLVVFIPGYHDPADAPKLPDVFGESPVSLLFTQLGYGFAATSFRGSGLMEPDTWIGGDLLELVATAETLLVNS